MTPAMLAKHRPATLQETPGEAWKRKRATSPVTQVMELLMNRSGSCYCSYFTSYFRYKHLRKDEESSAAPSTPTTKPKEKVEYLALFLYCFCFSKFCSFSASAPPRLLLPRPQRSTTLESAAWRE